MISGVLSHGSVINYSFTPTAEAATPADILSKPQRVWLGALEWCESRGRVQAVNPKDRDNTPSYGLLQFKPATFNYYAEKYGIATTSKGYMDGGVQELIVEQMILKGVDWSQQFPDCTKRLGLPPKLSTQTT